jgi:hypothetical protein
VAYLAAPDEMLHSLLPQNNYSITGCISLFSDPIIPVSKEYNPQNEMFDFPKRNVYFPKTKRTFRTLFGMMFDSRSNDLRTAFDFSIHFVSSRAGWTLLAKRLAV